ncbi:autoinducer 2 import system permease protein LsrC [Clostridium puniceum]|uniref:Autoinducer 2 import system permease protein LsrC n=1 Tax=Clostridium puniceum TaxID=29367 RepID=A0A1S8TVE7_9CLOT|nr:ABC transporter permease [Clostridium puniceum]OOM81542.1 autoinducer 2 import system permease protein LsrC [Clostridium puniceum]
MGVLLNILEQGLLFSLVAIAVYITYKILDFPDMSVDGTFPMGAAISAALLVKGINPWTSIIAAVIVGGVAGGITGFLHVKFKIDNLMAGILMMIGLYSINLRIMGKANVPLFNVPNLFKSPVAPIIIIIVMLAVVKIIFDLYMKTKSGFLLMAVGDNEQVVSSLGVNKDLIKILGLVISNGLAALAGALTAQYQGFSDVGMGTGTVVMGLAAVIIGSSLFEKVSFIKATTLSILGAVIYKAAIAIVLKYGSIIGLTANDLKLMTAIIVVIALCSNNGVFKIKKKKIVEGGAEEDVKSKTTIQSI